MPKDPGRIYKTQGVVLKRKNIGEQDRIITIFTQEHGKIRTIAKGVRRVPSRRAGHIEVFTHAQFTLYKGKTFDYIQEAQTKTSFQHLAGDLVKVSFCYYICELIDRLVPDGQESEDIFYRFLSSLGIMANSTSEVACHEELYRFALDLLWELGYLPRNQTIPSMHMETHIESIIERKLKTPKLLELAS